MLEGTGRWGMILQLFVWVGAREGQQTNIDFKRSSGMKKVCAFPNKEFVSKMVSRLHGPGLGLSGPLFVSCSDQWGPYGPTWSFFVLVIHHVTYYVTAPVSMM